MPYSSDAPLPIEDALDGAINRILLTLGIFGLFASTTTLLRDIEAALPLFNSAFNLLMVVAVAVLYLLRRRLHYRVKTWWAVFILYAIGIKSVVFFGLFTGAWTMLVQSAVVVFAMERHHRGLRYCLFMLLTFVPLAILCNLGPLPIDSHALPNDRTPYQWLSITVSLIFHLAVIYISVSHLYQSFRQAYDTLNSKHHTLALVNQDLRSEMVRNQQIQQELKNTEERLQAVFDSNLDGMLLTNIEGGIREVNPALTKLIGITREETLGRSTKDFVVEEDWHKIDERRAYSRNGEPIPIQEVRMNTPFHGVLTMELNSAYLYLRDETLILTTTRDVTERNRAEQAKMRAMIMAEEQERSRLAKDLHDDLGPILSTLKMYIQSLRHVQDEEEKADLMQTVLQHVDDSIKSVREISYNLSPHLLENMGLLRALDTFLQRLQAQSELQTSFEHNFDDSCRVSTELERLLYRVALELVNNTLKYAQASRIQLSLTKEGTDVRLNYQDDGVGFDAQEVLANHQGGIGIKNIVSRVKSVQGLVNFRREKEGMHISIYIPQTKDLNLWETSG